MEQDKAPVAKDSEKKTAVFAMMCLLMTSITGGGLLVWWAVVFHPYNKQLWMVPFSLIVLGTPIIVWLVLFASDSCQDLELLVSSPPAAALDVDVEK
ncbi:putative ATP-synthase-associated protein [Dioscorea sansibarensis]